MTEQTLGQRIADQRKKLGLSQETLGEKMGVSRQAISKWESDGAIPEIDKLITLSRLYGVSVGWLLGEEALPESREAAPAEVPRLQTAKQIMKNQLADHPWWRTAAWIIIALSAVFVAFTSFLRLHRINQIELDTWIVQSDVDRLEHRIQQLEFLQEAADRSGTLLAGYSFNLAPAADKPETEVTFTAAPRTWEEGDSAYLCVNGSGVQPLKVPCQWDGDSLRADLNLPLTDGFELSFVIVHPDGSRQLQLLPDSTMESLAATYAISLHGSVRNSAYNVSSQILTMEDFGYSYNRPDCYNETDVTWQKIELFLLQDGEKIWQQTEFDASTLGDSTLTSGGGIRGRGTFRIDLGEVGGTLSGRLELKLSAALSNGVSAETLLGNWYVEQNGTLTAQDS